MSQSNSIPLILFSLFHFLDLFANFGSSIPRSGSVPFILHSDFGPLILLFSSALHDLLLWFCSLNLTFQIWFHVPLLWFGCLDPDSGPLILQSSPILLILNSDSVPLIPHSNSVPSILEFYTIPLILHSNSVTMIPYSTSVLFPWSCFPILVPWSHLRFNLVPMISHYDSVPSIPHSNSASSWEWQLFTLGSVTVGLSSGLVQKQPWKISKLDP